jgi:hypothetical protein
VPERLQDTWNVVENSHWTQAAYLPETAMPEIEDPDDFVYEKNATVIDPLQPPTHQEQRGPSCGFYALSYVMQYWYEQAQEIGEDFKLTQPLQPRTEMDVTDTRRTKAKKLKRKEKAGKGTFTSLRQFGKYNKLTAYGSVFNANNLVSVARGAGSQFAGQYDGKTITSTTSTGLITKVKQLVDSVSCPVIIPFDVSVEEGSAGDPIIEDGKGAHWAVLVGYYEEEGKTWFINYHWGEYRFCSATDMANSCLQLHANAFLIFHKYEIRDPETGNVLDRDNMTEETADMYRKEKYIVTRLAANRVNYEFCDPQWMKTLTKELKLNVQGKERYTGTKPLRRNLKKHGFNPENLANSGLRGKMVAVYPTYLSKKILEVV